jgi:hypothetical protein
MIFSDWIVTLRFAALDFPDVSAVQARSIGGHILRPALVDA